MFALPFEAGCFKRKSPVPCFVAGACGEAAVEALDRRLSEFPVPDLVISAGLAGGLDPQWHCADIVFADSSCPKLLARLARHGIAHPIVNVHTAGSIVATPREKRLLFESGAGSVCDMETRGIADLCARKSIRFLGVRAVSDDAREGIPVPPDLLLEGNPMRLVAHLVARPTRIPAFCRTVGDAGRARQALARALNALLTRAEDVPSGMLPGL